MKNQINNVSNKLVCSTRNLLDRDLYYVINHYFETINDYNNHYVSDGEMDITIYYPRTVMTISNYGNTGRSILAKIKITVVSNKNNTKRENFTCIVNVMQFIVYPNMPRKISTNNDNSNLINDIKFPGLGTELFIFAMKYLYENKITSKDAIIHLTAIGREEYAKDEEINLSVLSLYKSKYPNVYNGEDESSTPSATKSTSSYINNKDNQTNYICEFIDGYDKYMTKKIISTERLVLYYQNKLNLSLITDMGIHAYMTGTIQDTIASAN